MLVAPRARGASARSGRSTRNPLYRTLFSMACWSSPCRRPGCVYTRSAAARARSTHARRRSRGRWSARPPPTSSATPCSSRPRSRCRPRQPIVQRLERELPVERAELLRRRRRRGGRPRAVVEQRRLLARAAGRRAALPHLPHLQGLPGPHRGRAAARAADVRPAPGDDRGAGAAPSTPRIRPRRATSGACRSTPPASRGRSACRQTRSRA